MTGNQTLIARILLSAVAGMLGIAAVSSARLRVLPRQTFDRLVVAAFILSRLTLYLGIFLIARIPPRGDIPSFYWDQANHILSGLVPYRDFLSSYAPLHPYLDALLVRIWFNPLSIILFSICVEWFLLPIWLRVGRRFLSEHELRTGTLLYLTSAISLQFVAIDGQDNVIIATLLVLAVLLLYRNRSLASGVSVGIGVAAVKFLPLLYAPAFFLSTPRRWRWVAGLAIPLGLVYGTCFAKNLPFLSVFSLEGGLKSANNLPYLVEAVLGVTLPPRLLDGILFVVLAVIFLLIANVIRQNPRALKLRVLTFGMAAITLALVLFSKKSWPPYLMLALFPICLLVPTGSRLKSAAFALFGVVAVAGPSIWATILFQFSSAQFHQGLLAHQTKCFIFLAVQTALVLSYSWLLSESIRQIVASPHTPSAIDSYAQSVSVP